MSNFTPLVEYKTNFDGDNITMQLQRLKRKDIMKVAPYLNGDIGEDGEMTMSFENQIQFAEVMAEVLPGSVKSFIGLKDTEGNAIDIGNAIEEAYFQDLISEIMGKLFAISKPSEAELKNSEAESQDTSQSNS